MDGAVWVTYASSAVAGTTRLTPAPARTMTVADGLLDGRVGQVVSSAPGILCFSYDPALDLGVSVLTGTVWSHFAPANSPLADGKVAELTVDPRGGVWVRYADDGLGIARVTGGKAVNYTGGDTALPVNTVDLVVPEPPDSGLPGDLVWFSTVDGLTRLDLGSGEWKHFGRKHGQTTDFMNILGLDQVFAKAILDIRGIAFTPGTVWVMTPRKLFRFDGVEFRPVSAKFVEGLERLRFSSISVVSGTVWVSLSDLDSRKQSALASYADGIGWRQFPLRDSAVPVAEEVVLCPAGGNNSA